tara:strand:- start:30 stop:467 length:438 start_codon:yes stop_codon:yes gene_type:complete
MEQKKSKITELNLQEDKFNDMYVFTIQFENGDIGKMYKKKETPYEKVGDFVEYTISPKGTVKMVFKGASSFTSSTPQSSPPKATYSNSGNDRERMIVKQSTLKVSVELHIALGDLDRSNVKDTAQYFTDWVMDNQEEKKESNLPF